MAGWDRFSWVVFDLDGTLARTSTMAFLATQAGWGDLAARLTSEYTTGRSSNAQVSDDYAPVLQQLVAERSEDAVRNLLDGVELYGGISAVVDGLHGLGVKCGIATITFDVIAEHFRARFGFDRAWASTLKRDVDGRLTGLVDAALEADDKARHLEDFFAGAGVDLADVAFVGDGRSDIDIMRRVGLSVAFNASEEVRSIACIDVGASDLTRIFSEPHPLRCADRWPRTCHHAEVRPWTSAWSDPAPVTVVPT